MFLSIRSKIVDGVRLSGLYLMKGRREAAIAAILAAAIPFLGWLSLVIVCLVTLRKGMKEGMIVAALAIIPAIFSCYLVSSGALALENFIAYVCLWLVSGILRRTSSWRYVLEIMSGLAITAIVILHWQIPDLNTIYFHYLMDLYQNTGTDAINGSDIQEYVQHIVAYLLGVQMTLYVLHNLLFLLIARGWQATLFNPGGLPEELKNIRLGFPAWIVAVVFLFLGIKMSMPWALDSLPVLAAFFFIAGLSVVHYWISLKSKYRGVTLIFYILLVLLFPFSVAPVIFLALIDTSWDIRKKFKEVK